MKSLIKFFVGGVVVCGLALLCALPTMLLWNAVMPELFHVPAISFWQALGLLLLSGLLFRGDSLKD